MDKTVLKPVSGKLINSNQPENNQFQAQVLVRLSHVIFSILDEKILILLSKNKQEGLKNQWSLPCEMLHQNENLASAAANMLFSRTNQENVSTELLEVSTQENASFEQILSVVYFACVTMEGQKAEQLRKYNTKWHQIEELPWLHFDQHNIVKNALEHVRYNATLRPSGFEFLPDNFTIPQLQKVYEAIFNMEFDRRNFSKKILATGLLIDTGLKLDLSITNKAKLYKLDKAKYKGEFCRISTVLHAPKRIFPFL